MRSTSPLLIHQTPTMFQRDLVMALGLTDAIILQQLHYWLGTASGKEHDGRRWVFNTYDQWQEQFPWWSTDTIQRAIKRLRDSGIIIATDTLNRSKMERTLWYSIDYDALDAVASENVPDDADSPADDSTERSPVSQSATVAEVAPDDSSEQCPVSQNAVLLEDSSLRCSLTIDYQENTRQENKEPTVLAPQQKAPTQQSMVGAILRVFGLAMTNEIERGKITKAAKLLRESGATEEELERRVANYRRKWPQIDCTPLAMASHWAEMEHVEPAEPMRRVTYKEQAAINGRTNLESVVAAIKEREHGRGHVQVGDGQAARGVPPRDVGDVPRVVGRVVGIPARV